MNSEAVHDWLRVRRELLARESAFTDLAIRVAAGQETEEVLQQERQALETARQVCSAAYLRAFPARTSQTLSSPAAEPGRVSPTAAGTAPEPS